MKIFIASLTFMFAFILGFTVAYRDPAKIRSTSYSRGIADGFSVCNDLWKGKIKTEQEAFELIRTKAEEAMR